MICDPELNSGSISYHYVRFALPAEKIRLIYSFKKFLSGKLSLKELWYGPVGQLLNDNIP